MRSLQKANSTWQHAALTMLLGLSLSAPSEALEVQSLSLATQGTYGYALERQGEKQESQQAQIELTPRGEFGWGNTTFVIEGRARFDEERKLSQTGERQYNENTYSSADRPAQLGGGARLELRDAYAEFSLGNHLFRLGKQQIVWGALDGLKVADVLNPQSFREFILDDFGHSRIPLWSALADFSIGDWRAELAWVPQTSAHELPGPQDTFAFTAARFNLGQTSHAANGSLAPQVAVRSPPNKLNRGGLRLSRRVGPLDMSLVAARSLDFEPLVELEMQNGNPELTQNFRSVNFYGLSAESSVGPLALRAEVGWRPNRYFNTLTPTGPSTAKLEQLTLAIAADFNAPAGIFANFQLLHDEVRNAPNALVRPERDTIATVLLRRQFRYDTLTLDVRWYGSLNEHDGLGRVQLSYAVSDNLKVNLGLDRFYGDPNGLFGQFAGADRVTFSFTHTL